VNEEKSEEFHDGFDTLGWDELLHSVIKLKFGKLKFGKQKAESRKQKAESRKQKAESRKQKAESRKQKAESRKQKAEMGRLLPSSYLTIQYSPSRHRPEFAGSALFG
jgi:hypothetical protein